MTSFMEKSLKGKVSPEIRVEIKEYVLRGKKPDGIVKAVITNNLSDALLATSGEEITVEDLCALVVTIWDLVPQQAKGSRENMKDWITGGGWNGMNPEKELEDLI